MTTEAYQSKDKFYDDATWKLKFAWLPHRCYITGKEIWFEHAYHGRRSRAIPSGITTEHRWLDKETWIVEKLKGTI